eukprot:Skav227468  [mRNA]  locus=scaffold2491:351255:353809:+ [translate_table: standard]
MGTDLDKALEALSRKLRDASPSTRLEALEASRNLAAEKQYRTRLQTTVVLEAVGNPHAEVRVAMFDLLGQAFWWIGDDNSLKLLEGLKDDDADVRRAAFQWLGTKNSGFFWRNLNKYGLKLDAGLQDPVEEVRVASFNAIQQCMDNTYTLGLEDAEVRAVAFQSLRNLSADLQRGLRHPAAEVRVAALQCFLKCSSPEDLEAHATLQLTLAKGLEDPELQWTWDLSEYIQEQMKGLENQYPEVREAASRALSNLSSVSRNGLARDAAKIVGVLDAQWGSGPTHAQKGSLHASMRWLFRVPIEDESKERDTWLHIAAQRGSTTVCQALLASGVAMKSLRNAKHRTASDVALLHHHADLAELLSPEACQMRGGSGGAIAKSLDSDEGVKEVSWWFFPLPGWEGTLGACHSMLKIDTENDQYLIEGACPEKVKPEGVQRPEIEKAAANGLFISKWAEFKDADNIEELTHVKPCRPSGVALAALVRHLLQLGPYNVGSNNCHHTAFHGYNFCAAEQLPYLPINEVPTTVAWILYQMNIDLARSRSCGKQLPSLPMYGGIPRDENVTLELPRCWTGEVQDGAVDLDKGSDEFLQVEAYLKKNGGDKIPGFQIVDIKRNQNLKMLKVFRTELHKMHEQRQLRVFHSASNSDVHDKVMEEGFKVKCSSMKFNAYGAGIYFAQDLRLSDHFASSSSAGLKKVFLCSVAVGKSHVKERIFDFVPGDRWSGKSQSEWTSQLIEPEHRDAPDGYDSCIAESREALIVYRGSQVLWDYAIQYKSTGSAGNPYGDLRGFLKEVPQN